MKRSVRFRLSVFLMALCLLIVPMLAAAALKTDSNVPQNRNLRQTRGEQIGAKAGVNASRKVDLRKTQGEIAISTPASNATWYTGSTQIITWSVLGSAAAQTGLFEVTLWKNGQQVTSVANAVSGSTEYKVPLSLPAGVYELRVTSKKNPDRVARKSLNIVASKVEVGAVPPVMKTDSNYTINWAAVGVSGPIDIALMYERGGNLHRWFFIARNVNPSARSYVWKLDPYWKVEQYKLRIQLSDSATGTAYSTSGMFAATGMKFTTPKTGDKLTSGSPYNINWDVDGDPTVPISLKLRTAGGGESVIAGNLKTGDRSFTWQSPAPTQGNSFQMVAYAGSPARLVGTSDTFSFNTPDTPGQPTQTVGKPQTNNNNGKITNAAHAGMIAGQKLDLRKPQGEITISTPASNATWYTGSSQTITWSVLGSAAAQSGLFEATLWRNGQQATSVATAAGGGSTVYKVPLSLPAGPYELRVTSKNNPTLEARQSLNIVASKVAVGFVPRVVKTGSNYTINWTTVGSPGPIDIVLMTASGGTSQRWIWIARNVDSSAKSYVWSLDSTFNVEQYRLELQLSDSATGIAYSTSEIFTVTGMKFTTPKAGEKLTSGSAYNVNWNSDGDPTVPIDLKLRTASGSETVIASNLKTGTGGFRWQSPASAQGDNLQVVAYTGSPSILVGTSETFSFNAPAQPTLTIGKPHTNTISDDAIVAAHPYFIPCTTSSMPASAYYKIEIVGATDNKVLEFIKSSARVLPSNSVYFEWYPSANHQAAVYGKSYKVRFTALDSNAPVPVADSPAFIIKKQAPSSGSSPGSSTGSTSTGTVGMATSNSGSTSSSSSGNSSGNSSNSTSSGSSSSQQLTQNTTLNYSPTRSANFHKNSIPTFDANGYVLTGQLSSDQQLYYSSNKSAYFRVLSGVTFSNGFVQRGQLKSNSQALEYGPNRNALFRQSSVANFENGYLKSGQLDGDQSLQYKAGRSVSLRTSSLATFSNGFVIIGQLSGRQGLEYGSGRSAYFRGSSQVTFSNGYVVKGQLDSNQYLDYAPGKSALFLSIGMNFFRAGGYLKSGNVADKIYFYDTTGKSVEVPAKALVNFDDSGRLTSFTPGITNIVPAS